MRTADSLRYDSWRTGSNVFLSSMSTRPSPRVPLTEPFGALTAVTQYSSFGDQQQSVIGKYVSRPSREWIGVLNWRKSHSFSVSSTAKFR